MVPKGMTGTCPRWCQMVPKQENKKGDCERNEKRVK